MVDFCIVSPFLKWRQTMKFFIMPRPFLMLLVLVLSATFLMSEHLLAAIDSSEGEFDIVGGWSWQWRNNTGYTVKECSGGEGKITVTYDENSGKRTLAFSGKVRSADGKYGDQITKSGTWEYLGQDPNYQNRRKYRFNWGNDKDLVIMSDSGNVIVGSNGKGLGKCRVEGKK